MEEITLSLNIADRPYKMVVKKSEEAVIRKAAELVEEKLIAYSQSYAFKDKQDLLAMLVLQFASSALREEGVNGRHKSEVFDRLNDIDNVLSQQLGDKNKSSLKY
ncbi:MAG: cell division protein ZapA [Hyphomicrobiales bacterium]